eukprot:CAMPEP_0179184790 /NCGR_PEP_ID=MMETSP0796-20121207/91624_1 /TAXON_ID=73915 /ORGANISM="Pyrodinium bahamense, Strain pbaha01" /LENGTH=175 /DNA_ID=CAMNT_0020888737 /DNA_START=55 /DNA_END=581 /DNA_ORIENTATION=-
MAQGKYLNLGNAETDDCPQDLGSTVQGGAHLHLRGWMPDSPLAAIAHRCLMLARGARRRSGPRLPERRLDGHPEAGAHAELGTQLGRFHKHADLRGREDAGEARAPAGSLLLGAVRRPPRGRAAGDVRLDEALFLDAGIFIKALHMYNPDGSLTFAGRFGQVSSWIGNITLFVAL